jgi:hypothetical protein
MGAKISAEYVSMDDKYFIQLSVSGKKIGQPILSAHYWAIRDENDIDGTHEFLSTLTPEQWEAIHMFGILDWRNHGVTR